MGDKLVTTMSGKFYYHVAAKGSNATPDSASIPTKEYADNANIVTLTEATTITKALHAGKTMLLSLLAGFTTTLPEAIGSGDVYKFKVGIVRTSNSYIITSAVGDSMSGFVSMLAATPAGFLVDGTDAKLTLNATTTGGLTIGDTIVLTDAQDGVWHVEAYLTGSGTLATPAAAL